MSLTEQQVLALMEGRETVHLECKSAKGGLPGSVWETYSAFSNTDGGVILLGCSERRGDFVVTGVADADALRKTFWTTIKCRTKVNVCTLQERDVYPVRIKGKTVLVISVPRAPRQIRPVYLSRPQLRELSGVRACELTFVLPKRPTIKETGPTTLENTEGEVLTRNRIVAVMEEDEGITTEGIATRLGLSFEGVRYHLKILRQEGRIVHVGSTKAGRWVVKNLKKG